MKRSFSLTGYVLCIFLGHSWSLMWLYDEDNWKSHDCKRCGHSGIEIKNGKRYHAPRIGRLS